MAYEKYEFDSEINIASGKEYGSVDVHIQVRRIADELVADSQYVIPFTISKADGADINDDKNDVLILFNLREPFIRQESYGTDEGASVGSMNFTRDRKSTRLNSSHVASSYAVFCLNTKK